MTVHAHTIIIAYFEVSDTCPSRFCFCVLPMDESFVGNFVRVWHVTCGAVILFLTASAPDAGGALLRTTVVSPRRVGQEACAFRVCRVLSRIATLLLRIISSVCHSYPPQPAKFASYL